MLFWVLQYVSFEVKSLVYTNYYSIYNPADCFLDPFFTFIGRIVGLVGYVFVVVAVCLLSMMIGLQYFIYLPLILRTLDPFLIVAHGVFGHWILINLVFHYYKAWSTPPGTPPNDSRAAKQIIGVCKKCVAPKPPRSHHCSVCKKCILKMDHHCPWINNCVGHYNHRYFFMFVFFVFIGALYIVLCAVSNFKVQYSIMKMFRRHRMSQVPADYYYHKAVMFHFSLAAIACVPVGFLLLQQLYLVATGQTVIEMYTNKRESIRCHNRGLEFRNIYHYGWKKNFLHLFGITQKQYEKDYSWLRLVLLPSSHEPLGNGLSWFPPDVPSDSYAKSAKGMKDPEAVVVA